MSINISNSLDNSINISKIYSGDIFLLNDNFTNNLIEWCNHCLEEYFDISIINGEISQNKKKDFVKDATACKKFFTNCDKTKSVLEDLIFQRYKKYSNEELYYDVPRLRIIPNSNFLNSGISYNYKPHRDTWYGADQNQINHWVSVKNVTENSTFFIAPQYFETVLKNSSDIFDLDEWDKKYRNQASLSKNLKKENRPHPLLKDDIDKNCKIGFPISKGNEICFSGHHLHGSLENTTNKVRVSIDYRVYSNYKKSLAPNNLDSSSKGNFYKYMVKHPMFG